MTPEKDRWPEVKQIIGRALKLPFEERRNFVTQNCPDPDLQGLALLFVSDPEATPSDLSTEEVSTSGRTPVTGKRVGHYEVHHLLGRGGFGAVYLGVRADNNKRVAAIKFLRENAGESALNLFLSEMRLLALMNHPNVVAWYDAGITADSQPYYVMEYVEGWDITKYCATNRLGIRQRLELFLQVCDAVQYTHENLVVHRDLKPSNIRVTAEGRVKLLDFGIAKTSRPERTGEGPVLTGAIGTPCYASPEQFSEDNEPVTKVSDTYSLGAILFELLTTRTPFRCQGVPQRELIEAVRKQNPPLMSTVVDADAAKSLDAVSLPKLRKGLRGDLDGIVARALRKEPNRRYPSASALADDIRRHLARRRNWTPVIAAAVASIGLVVGLIARWERPSKAPSITQPTSQMPGMTPEEMAKRGDDFHLGRGVPKDDVEAVNWYRRSAELGFPSGQSGLGNMYLMGWGGVERSPQEALRLFRAAAEKGDARGENGLGIMSENGYAVERNYVDAMNWYLKAAASGYANAQSNLGGMYHAGHGVSKNYEEAMKWYRKAADQGSAGGERGIGLLYCYGLGVPTDYGEAMKWFRMAAEQGDGPSQSSLGYMYERGWGVAQSYDEALTWYKKAAGQRDSSGEYNLGVMYAEGRGVDKDPAEAIKWLEMSAKQGNSSAQAYLGAMYADGIDGRPNYFEAAKWFQQAADQDDPVAMDFLGELHENGWGGVPQDLDEAIKWYRKAAKAGDDKAKKNLARLGLQ